MELVNVTRMVAGYNVSLDRHGRELLVVVVKGTFRFPGSAGPLQLADQQLPLIMADAFTGEPGRSAPVAEVDFAPHKMRCDVLLVGTAHAPGGRPKPRVEVGLRVGTMTKRFLVVGNRKWDVGLMGISTTSPEPFTAMSVSYDDAFGGVDDRHPDPAKHDAFMANPVGRGFHKHLRADWVDGSALPNTEELNRPIDRPDSKTYRPMSFGPLGRGWQPRSTYAGTYDEKWRDSVFPFLPPDFDEQYYQAAPLDQQITSAEGGEEVRLINLTPEGDLAFTLPRFEAPIEFFSKRSGREQGALRLDTIVIEPDERRCTLAWRATRPIRRNVFEVAQAVVGQRPHIWWAEPRPEMLPISSSGENRLTDASSGDAL